MLITFKSKASADIIMYEKHVQPLFDILGKDIKRGVITSDECAHVISVIEQKSNESAHQDATDTTHSDTASAEPSGDNLPVSFSARFYPLLEMLKASEKKHCDILWGV